MKPQPDPDLTESYQRFYSGIQEQADGLMQSGSIDAFCRTRAGLSDGL